MMQAEWVVSVVSAIPLGGVTAQDMVAICAVSDADPESHVQICDDEASAVLYSQVIAEDLGLPLYDGADAYTAPVDVAASGYVDPDYDGPDRYYDRVQALRTAEIAEEDAPCRGSR